jgi:hypothetical protein
VLFELWVLPVLVELYLATGRREAAADGVARGFALLTPGQNWRGLPAPMHLARATVAAAGGRWADAEHDFEAAVALTRRYGLPFDEARTLAAWGAMYAARGARDDRERARERLGPALALFERVDAARDAAKVRAALARLA